MKTNQILNQMSGSKINLKLLLGVLILLNICPVMSKQAFWHGQERELRYQPEGQDFVIVNGNKRFNKALYGTNTAFRVETGDVPEFGFFMPNMGGNMQLGIIANDKSLWLNKAEYIKSIYRAGSRIYEIKDPVLGNGILTITVLAMGDADGMVMKVEGKNIPANVELLTMYGGASNKRFSRNGDLGVDDPESFSLKPEGCINNFYDITKNTFLLSYGKATRDGAKTLQGVLPEGAELRLSSPYSIRQPLEVWKATADEQMPVLVSKTPVAGQSPLYIAIKALDENILSYKDLAGNFKKAEEFRKNIAETVVINTPDPYFNTLGGVLSMAADGIWDGKVWQHGAVGWRMPLNGWRAAYVGDVVGWHERARIHFDGYAASQVKNVPPTIPHPAQDEKLNLTRAAKIWGTQMYSNGYICRNPYDTSKMHHYDMNLCYIDELLWHFNWTGDMGYVKKMWPTLKLHLEWEKRNFDPDNDGLYDAYACIWASDALMYNSGGVTHSTAYNYRSNRMAAEIAKLIGEDPKPYEEEANKILNAVNSKLWLADKGWWAEYKDFMGNKITHPNAGVWTVYHAIDSDLHDKFQAYQATRYVDEEIPHIPVLANGLKDEGYKTISTTNWLPYSWSINNVAFAEVAHTSLAYWQAGRYDEAFKLFKSSVLDGMYIGSTPGNIGQVSFYDAARGECYRDFGDPVGVYSRVLIQGLFGILPDAMNSRVEIRPGYPSDWNYASLSTPDIGFYFKREANKDVYTIENKFKKELSVELVINAIRENIKSVKVNDTPVSWSLIEGIDKPAIKINCNFARNYIVEIEWDGAALQQPVWKSTAVKGEEWILTSTVKIAELYDPQQVLKNARIENTRLTAEANGANGHRTCFVKLEQGDMKWWQAVGIEMKEPFGITDNPESDNLQFSLTNNMDRAVDLTILVNQGANGYTQSLSLGKNEMSAVITVPAQYVKFGTNTLVVKEKGNILYETFLMNWNLKNNNAKYETVVMDKVLNASVSQIFTNEYLSPRSPYTTLQTPKQGIGEWCHPTLTAEIDDSGLRKAATNNIFETPFGIPFRTTGDATAKNVAFTTLWDNYPESVTVPLQGKAAHAYLMMAGTTNHMQCHIANGIVTVYYEDGSCTTLELINPENWTPIEQDFYVDGYAFSLKQPRPYRVAFKTGIVSRDMQKDMHIKPREVYGRSIDGGAGIIVDLPLDKNKELKEIEVKSVANEVVVGLMGVTLLR